MLAQIAKNVGIPDGVINIVHGFGPGSAGEFLTQHEDVAAITFTGETRTGTAIMKAAAEGTRPVSFELGGKNAGIVFADCDFEAAVEGITRSTYLNSGQVCLGTERVFVERPIFDKFVAALKAKAEALVIGDPMNAATTFGPLISLEHRDKVLSYFKRALNEGATLVTGGGVPSMPVEQSQGAWIQPTIWTGLSDDASVMREEIFGPCCNISPFDSEDEVVRRANDTRYGLSTTVWTTDLSRAHRMARHIEVGTVWINAWWLRDLRVPFGGSGLSGIGREGGEHSLDFYSEIRTVCVKL
jgi:aminomuconate-semialdehyde/2-hydroxymuconate-6-semialdehyde dehydrogenase